jgi:hypothetical protein
MDRTISVNVQSIQMYSFPKTVHMLMCQLTSWVHSKYLNTLSIGFCTFTHSITQVGMMLLLDEQCRFPRATDQTFVAMLVQNHERNANFKKNRFSKDIFHVVHFAGEVEYTGTLMESAMDTSNIFIINRFHPQTTKSAFLVEHERRLLCFSRNTKNSSIAS